MKPQPTLETERLILRPLENGDAARIQELAGEREIAANTLAIPHPYTIKDARWWIKDQRKFFARGERVDFVMTRKEDSILVGAIGLGIDRESRRGELGYWVGKPYWNLGYASEAARTVLRYGFEVLGLNRIQAWHFKRNPASGRVLEKAGMTREGCLRQHVLKWGVFEDQVAYGIPRDEFHAERRPT